MRKFLPLAAMAAGCFCTTQAVAQMNLTQTKQDISFVNTTKNAIWVTTYADGKRDDHLAHGCVPAEKAVSIGGLSVGRTIATRVWVLAEVKSDKVSCGGGNINAPLLGPFTSRYLYLRVKDGHYSITEK